MKTQTPEEIAAEKIWICFDIYSDESEESKRIAAIIAEHATKPYREALEKAAHYGRLSVNSNKWTTPLANKAEIAKQLEQAITAAESLLNNCPKT